MTGSPRSPWQRIVTVLRQRLPWWPEVDPPRPHQEPSDKLHYAIADYQQRLLLEAFKDAGGVGGIPFGKGNEQTAYLAHPTRVLVRDGEDRRRVDRFFDERKDIYEGRGTVTQVLDEALVSYELPARREDGGRDSNAALEELEKELGQDVVMPDHIVYVTPQGIGKLCPASEPELPLGKGPVPPLTTDARAGLNVRVSVVDTGWYEAAATNAESPWLDATTHEIEGDLETVDPTDIHPYAGHGTFVAGIIRCLAPATELEIEGVLTRAGAVYESEIVAEFEEAMRDRDHPALISISAGTYTRKDRGLMALDVLAERYEMGRGCHGPLVVAAAGNDDTDRPFYPAAYDWTLAVGAVDERLCVPEFSNYGEWVDVWAHGTQLVNAFPVGTYVVKEPGPTQGEVRSFTGLAQWSGTSFATPIVTGAIAAYMSEHGVSARDAAQALKAAGKSFNDPKAPKGIAIGPPFV